MRLPWETFNSWLFQPVWLILVSRATTLLGLTIGRVRPMWLLARTGCWLIKVGLTPSEIRSLTTFQDRLQTIIPFSSLIGLLSVGNHLLSLRKCGLPTQLSKIWSKNVGIPQLVVMLNSFYTKNSNSLGTNSELGTERVLKTKRIQSQIWSFHPISLISDKLGPLRFKFWCFPICQSILA